MPLGAAMTVLASFLLLQGCWEVEGEIGGRHIRRITAADLPSSNSTNATKVRLKKSQVKGGANCTKEGSCMNAMTAAPRSNSEGKTTSSFPADDVLQERLHSDVLTYLTTTGSPYDGAYDSYFDGDDFGERTASVPKKLSFRDVYRAGTERMNYDTPLTTPRISLFDDFYAKVTEGIRQNLEEMDEHRFLDVSRLYGDNVQEGHRTAPVTVLPPSTSDPTDRTDEKVALEFLSKLSVVYNDSKMSNSVRRDIVVENGTHIDFERSHVETKLEPEINRTIFYISNDTHSRIIPSPTSVSTTDSRNGSQTSHNNAAVNHSSADELFLESLGYSSPHPNMAINMIMIQNNNTGTPGDKDSTTSESKRDRSFSKSNGVRNNSSRENVTVISSKPMTLLMSNGTKSELIDTERKNTSNVTLTTSRSGAVVTKDSKSKAAGPVSTESDTNRGSRMVSSQSKNNSTNGPEQSSQTPLSGSFENNFSSDNATKKPRVKYNLRRTGTNVSEEQVESSTVMVGMTTRKAFPSVRARVDGKVSPQTKESARSRKNDTNPISGYGVTELPNDRSTTGYINSSRGRAFTYQRPYTAANNTTSDSEAQGGKGDSSTVRPSTSSSSVNTETVRRRLTTLSRRLQSSTTAPVTLYPTNNSTTESNAIVRGLPGIAGRQSAFKNTPSNKTENNEGNDIVSFKDDTYKPVTRSRGSARYGNQKNYTSEDIRNSSSVSSTPPTAAAWTLLSLKRPSNETRNLRQDNSTSDTHKRRWLPTRGRRPWSSEERESTTTASDEESTGSNLTSPKSTKLRPVTRVRGALSQKRTQQSSMQENRLSTIQVIAPTTEQDLTSTTEGEVLTIITTESKDVTTTSGAFYKQTETPIPITNTNTEISTSSDMGRVNISFKPYFIPPLQVTADPSMTTDDVTISTEFIGSTTEKSELTSVKDSTTVEVFHVGTLSVEDDILLSTVAADEPAITPTTETWFQEARESDVGLGSLQGTSDDVSSVREADRQGDGNKQEGSNADEKLLDGDIALSEKEDGTLTEGHNSEGVYSEGNISASSSGDESKNADDTIQEDNNQNSQKMSAIPDGGDNPYLLHKEAPDNGSSEAVTLDYTSDVATAEVTDTATTTGTETSPSVGEVEIFTPSEGEQVTTWGSSPSAIEWDADSTTLPSVYNVPFYLILSINASWPDFCDHLAEFKQSVVTLMFNNDRCIESYQVILPNADSTRCPSAEASPVSPIEVEMYLANESSIFDYRLTLDFYTFWRESGLPDFPFDVNTVQPAGQTSDAVSEGAEEGGGMIAAISISCIGAACLLLLAVLWVVMRKRQQRFNYGQRCTPVSLDAYSLDSVSVRGSVRRKSGARNSKRSYGNAGFDDPSAPSNPMGFAGLANFILNRESVEEEFARIPQVTANVDDMPEGADTKNRYANVIPLPETRVQLSPREGEPLSEYMNANFVHGPKNASKYYIACQAPMASTVIDFWLMIWEQQSKVILMLTDLVENGVEKSSDYLPPSEVLDCHRLFGDFQITLKKREVKEHYIISTLQLKNLETNSWREVMHLWYMSWPIQGVPEDASSLIAFLLEARPYMRGGPCVVHCSPGTGRTGTVIACDLCIRDFETTRIVDIPRCVARLRRDRAGAVQTRDQYAFIYQVINLYGTKLTGGALDSM